MAYHLPLNEEFKTWLQALGYAESSVGSLPQYIKEMLDCFKEKGILKAEAFTAAQIHAFFLQWKKRKNKTSGAGLSQSHINKAVVAIHLFVKFLNATGKHNLQIKLEREIIVPQLPEVLTRGEIQALYKASHTLCKRGNRAAYGQRDRAMLAVYYGCGLRKNEGASLLMSDVDLGKRLLHVRKGKGGKERLVPIAAQGLQDMEEYLQYGRNHFLAQRQKRHKPGSDYFFLNIKGRPMRNFTQRLVQLAEEARVSKAFSLHTLRHSIATHLLQAGMDMEQIRKFLGHASLESTQLYTHIVHGGL